MYVAIKELEEERTIEVQDDGQEGEANASSFAKRQLAKDKDGSN